MCLGVAAAAATGYLQCQWLQHRQRLSLCLGNFVRPGLRRLQLPTAASHADTCTAGVPAVHSANYCVVGLWQLGLAAAQDWARPCAYSTQQQVSCEVWHSRLHAREVQDHQFYAAAAQAHVDVHARLLHLELHRTRPFACIYALPSYPARTSATLLTANQPG
jgi:hypothetical protein